MDDKILLLLICSALIVIYLVQGMIPETIPETNEQGVTTTIPSLEEPLSELQITACNSADEGGTCETKLLKLDLVTPEDCCKYLGTCC